MFKIQNEKYYNQKELVDEIHIRTNCSKNDITKILNALGDSVKDIFSNEYDYVEIKPFAGLKFSSNFCSSKRKGMISTCLKSEFGSKFRKEISKNHKIYIK